MDDYGFYRDRNNSAPRRGLFSYLVTGTIGAVVGGMLVLTFAPAALLGRALLPEDSEEKSYEPANQMVIVPEKVEIALTTVIAQKIAPAVVGIRTEEDDTSSGKSKIDGSGSGVVIDKGGYVLTNSDVAHSNASSITVYLYDGRDVPASMVWTDDSLGLSILKIEADGLVAAELGDSENVEAGEPAIAMGNPLGLSLQRSVSKGVISASNRTIPVGEDRFMEGLIETDASINDGNNGGPLINSEGKVIGINTTKTGSTGSMGFAIPVNTIVPVIKSIVETGSFKAPYIGITGLDKEIALFYDYKIDKGIVVHNIDRKGLFYGAGIRKGDIILELNDRPVNALTSFKKIIFSSEPGSTIKIKYKDRSGNVEIIEAVLDPIESIDREEIIESDEDS